MCFFEIRNLEQARFFGSDISMPPKNLTSIKKFGWAADYLGSLKNFVLLFGGLKKLLDMSSAVPKIKGFFRQADILSRYTFDL